MCHMRRRGPRQELRHMRRRIHVSYEEERTTSRVASYEEEETCSSVYVSYEEEDTCVI
jgi:hypothetical protein